MNMLSGTKYKIYVVFAVIIVILAIFLALKITPSTTFEGRITVTVNGSNNTTFEFTKTIKGNNWAVLNYCNDITHALDTLNVPYLVEYINNSLKNISITCYPDDKYEDAIINFVVSNLKSNGWTVANKVVTNNARQQ